MLQQCSGGLSHLGDSLFSDCKKTKAGVRQLKGGAGRGVGMHDS